MRAWWLGVVWLAGCPATPDDEPDPRATEPFPRCDVVDPDRQPWFGDTHVHTTLSLDANLQGTRLRPTDAYRFAKGGEVGIQPYDDEGLALRTLQLERPLDWTVVSDHAEFLGTVAMCSDPEAPAYDDSACVAFRDNPGFAFITINGATSQPVGDAQWPAVCGDDGVLCKDAGLDVWDEVQTAAEAAYDRTGACTFTSFVGYEWSGGPDARNLHRNVIFRNEAVPALPAGYFDASSPSALWDALQDDCLDQLPCDAIAIPHNSNLSAGLMFETADDDRPAADRRKQRALEPLVEVFQHKGDSECWPGSTASDELCGFEKLPYDRLSGANLDTEGTPNPHDFVRDVLAEGLRFGDADGVNPYVFGIVASTDTHLGTPGAVDEQSYPGHGGAGQNNRDTLPPGLPDNVTFNPGGLAVLWAEENSREALFAAMKRREAYGTSGPRIVVRTFTGRGLDPGWCDDEDRVASGYASAAPMGGTVPEGEGPLRVAVHALADAGTASRPGVGLERVQVVKGWLDGDTPRFDVIDVAGGPDPTVTVDPDTCATVGQGAGSLCAVWEDPDFDPDVPAFWYVRVIESPTCRWSTWQCNAAGITCPTDDPDYGACCDTRAERVQQERAWTSPVWHLPDGSEG